RRNILTHRAGTTNHAVCADTTELMHGSQTAQNGPVANMHVAAQLDAVGDNRVIADLAIVSNVGVGHDPVVIAHTGHAHILHRTGIDGDVFTNHIAIADFQASRFTSVLLVLRHAADGAETVEMVVATNRGHAIYHAVRAHFGARPYRDIGPNDAVRPDLDIICKLSACFDDGR